MEIREIDLKFAAAERFLLQTLSEQVRPQSGGRVRAGRNHSSPDQINLARVSQNIGYSQKHFIAMFKQQVGITPKAYLKIIRFQKAITEIEERREVNWTDISQDCGFYDQAHFINDFKFFSGFTPERIRPKKKRRAELRAGGLSYGRSPVSRVCARASTQVNFFQYRRLESMLRFGVLWKNFTSTIWQFLCARC